MDLSNPISSRRRSVRSRRPPTVGIDLGTTNTALARNFEALRVEGNRVAMPSAVAFPPNGAVVVGSSARKRRAIDPRNTILSAKRVIGSPWASSTAAQYREHYPYALLETPDGGIAYNTRAGLISPTEVGTEVVKKLCEITRTQPRDAHAVVTAPVAFDQQRRNATLKAVEDAGFVNVRLIEEPVATALAYLNRSNLRYAFVYDLGGGTFDAAVVDCRRYPFRVVGHGGDPYLGGDDVDRMIARYVADRTLTRESWDLTNDSVTFDRLVNACELAKCELSETKEAAVAIPSVDPAAPQSCGIITITREQVRELTLDLARRTFAICDDVLGQARLRPNEIDAVFLAGGSSKLPGLDSYIESYFGTRPRADLDPMTVVSLGASLAAARLGVSELLEPCA